jgi:hypothetical protein
MFELFNTYTAKVFRIPHFRLNAPLNIKTLNDHYLSCHEKFNLVDFFVRDDNSNRQKWIIEQDDMDENVFYIKCLFRRYNYTQYLGCPNQNNRVFLYTSKNRFTKWGIKQLENDVYYIYYLGEKFNRKECCIAVSRYNECIDWVMAYNDMAVIYNKGTDLELSFSNVVKLENVGREGDTYLNHIIRNYSNLSKKTIFMQGDPFPHNQTVLFGIDNYEQTDDVQPFGLRYLAEKNVPTPDILNKYKTKTSYGLEYLVICLNDNI